MLPLKLLQEDPLVLPVMLQMCFSVLQQEANRLLLQVKQERMDKDDCNLDLKVEVNISSECSLSSGECLHQLNIVVQTSGKGSSSSHEGPQSGTKSANWLS